MQAAEAEEHDRLARLRNARLPDRMTAAEKVNLDIDADEARITLDLPLEERGQ